MQEKLTIFKTAKLASDRGFNWDTEYNFDLKEELHHVTKTNHNTHDLKYSTPTQSLLQKWLRDVHKIHIGIIWKGDEKYDFIIKTDPNRIINPTLKLYPSYEDALEVALFESLLLIK